MINNKSRIKTVLMFASILLLFATKARSTEYPYAGMDKEDCTVKSTLWQTSTSGNLTLLYAIKVANSSASNKGYYFACTKNIYLDVSNNIPMKSPLVIEINGSATVESGVQEGDYFRLIGGAKGNPKEVTLDASKITDWTYMDWDGNEKEAKCAVVIKGNSVRFKNIKVMNVPEGHDAVCFEGNGSVMDGVTVYSVKKGAAYKFGASAGKNIILPNSGAQAVNGHVIEVDNPSIQDISGNKIIPTNRAVETLAGENGLGVFKTEGKKPDVVSILLCSDKLLGMDNCDNNAANVEENEYNFDMTGFVGEPSGFFSSKAKAVVQLWKNTKSGDNIQFIGGVVKFKPEDAAEFGEEGPSDEFCKTPLVGNVSKLQIYKVNDSVPGFYNYVTTVGKGGKGLYKTGDANGAFQFTLPQDVGQIVIVPEFTGGAVGTASKVINVAQDTTQVDCPDREFGDEELIPGYNGNGGGDDGSGGSSGGTENVDKKKFISVQDCKDVRGITEDGMGGSDQPGYDSDGDGINDDKEDNKGGIHNCKCDEGETCWYDPDTDHDGILDGLGKETNDAKDGDDDGDGYTEALDSDSDNDGLADGEEDRNRSYRPEYSSHWYTFNSLGSYSRYKDAECELGQFTKIGVKYAWVIISQNNLPEEVTDFITHRPLQKGVEDMVVMVCKNDSISLLSVNGVFNEENGETNAYAADTDKDGYCDGDGSGAQGKSGCTDATKLNDKCPIDYDTTNTCAQIKCINFEVLYGVNQEYLDMSDGVPKALKDVKNKKGEGSDEKPISDTIPDVYQVAGGWQEVQTLCFGDMDHDGIPDCVERPSGLCKDPADSVGLDPYKADVLDNTEHKCPAGAPGCDPYKFYFKRQIVACFLDRDGDNLRDCQEDKNVDGNIDKKKSISDIDKTETDPLSANSDKDTLNDYQELNGDPHTNPVNEDTDGDLLYDNEEMGDDNVYINTVLEEGVFAGETKCKLGDLNYAKSAGFGETNPKVIDTDDDGLSDYLEVKVLGTNPNNPDSDGDGLDDGVEKLYPNVEKDDKGQIVLAWDESDPCSTDTDGDDVKDDDEIKGCANTFGQSCDESSNKQGPDYDDDGIPDSVEKQKNNPWGDTDWQNSDTDDDGLLDGCDKDGLGELCNHVKKGNIWQTGIDTKAGESKPDLPEGCLNSGKDTAIIKDIYKNGTSTPSFCSVTIGDPCGSDSDGDGLPDYYEKMFGTKPNNPDTDGDGIADGFEAKWVKAKENGKTDTYYLEEAVKGQEEYVEGSMTDPTVSDTDGDGLCDGNCNGTDYEDENCNGKVDTSAQGGPLELDPKLANSDGDQWSDNEEFCWNGICGAPNLGRALTGQRSGCASVGASSTEGETWGMTFMFLAMLIATRVAGVVMKRTRRVKSAVKH